MLLPTMAGPVVMASRVHCRLGSHRPALGAAAGSQGGAGAVGGVGEVEQVGAFSFIELEGAGDRVEHAGRYAAERAAFELGVILHAHLGELGDFAAAQSGDPSLPGLREAGLLGFYLGSPREEELADFCAVVHVFDSTAVSD